MSDFNYSDFLKSSSQKNYNSYMNDTYIQLNGQNIFIFKLDKINTRKSELYGSEETSRIYLPHFSIRSLYLTNKWTGSLDLNVYEEQENDISFVVNFDRMVQIHRDLKKKESGKLNISYGGVGTPFLSIKDNRMSLLIDKNIIMEKEFSEIDFNTIKKVINYINNLGNNFSASMSGNNEKSENLEDIDLIPFKGLTKTITIKDNTYKNITDVIEMGDLILTDKFRLYQVLNANPGGDIGWNYSTYFIKANTCDMSLADSLPNDYREIINKNQYGLNKIKKE